MTSTTWNANDGGGANGCSIISYVRETIRHDLLAIEASDRTSMDHTYVAHLDDPLGLELHILPP
jgi:hypothetical protein